MERKKELHIVMFPWLAHGHITQYQELAMHLNAHGLNISFVSTPLNIQRVKRYLSQLSPIPNINLVELALPRVEGLPAGVESDNEVDKLRLPSGLLVQAFNLCEKPFEALLRRLSPDFVIHDVLQGWTPAVAATLGIPTVFFTPSPAASTSFISAQAAAGILQTKPTVEDLSVPPPGFTSSVIRYRPFEARRWLPIYMSFRHQITKCMEGCWAVITNSCAELEGSYMEAWQKAAGRPIVPVGILMPQLSPRPHGDRCLEWLDKQVIGSVVFVSFGSQCTLTNEDVFALAMGLEESVMPFLWILPGHANIDLVLPCDFRDRMQGRGLVVSEWAPQLHILSHPSTGAFVTQCGWNSVTEGLRFGVPLVALPMQFEQGLTSKLITEDLKLGVEVRRNEDDGSFTKEDITKTIQALMVGEEGALIKSNVTKISELFTKDNYHVFQTNITNFVSMLQEKASKSNVTIY